MAKVVNGNKVYKEGWYWVVESATGEWDGFELYDTEEEAIEAAKKPNEEED